MATPRTGLTTPHAQVGSATVATGVQPLAVGYMVVRSASTSAEEMDLRQELVDFATDHGYRMCGIFVERDEGRSMGAMAGMLDTLRGGDVKYVIVPAFDHLGFLPGVRKAIKEWLERETGVDVLIIHGEAQAAGRDCASGRNGAGQARERQGFDAPAVGPVRR
jgi:hypothetical protein